MSLWIGYFCHFIIYWSTFLGSQQFVIDWTWWCFLAFHSVEVPFELPQVIKLEGVSDHRCGPEMHLFSLLISQGELQLPEKTNKHRKQRILPLQLFELKLFVFSWFEFLRRWREWRWKEQSLWELVTLNDVACFFLYTLCIFNHFLFFPSKLLFWLIFESLTLLSNLSYETSSFPFLLTFFFLFWKRTEFGLLRIYDEIIEITYYFE